MHLENWKHITRALIKARFTVAKTNFIDCKSFALPPFKNRIFQPPFKLWLLSPLQDFSKPLFSCQNLLLLTLFKQVVANYIYDCVLTKWWAKLCFDKTQELPQMAACQELLSAHCFHKKGSPAVCLLWATPVKVPWSPFGVWINCIKGHVYYLCFQCILAEGDRIRGTCVSTVSVSRLFVHFAIMVRRVQWSFEELYSGLLKESIASFWKSL